MPIIDVGGCRIRYETWGEGPSVALLHGFTSFIEQNWLERKWVELLTDAGHQVIGVDLRGHGRSSKPSRPEDYETALLASDVVRVFDELGVARSDVFEFSMGAGVGSPTGGRHRAGRAAHTMILSDGRFRSTVLRFLTQA
jgi:pimeloyl-ACP methyl ester carboxylesterase